MALQDGQGRNECQKIICLTNGPLNYILTRTKLNRCTRELRGLG